MATQTQRAIAVSSPLGADVLLFHRMTGSEHLGRPFEYELDLLSKDGNVKLTDVLGQPLSVRVDLPDDKPRQFHGLCCRFRQAGTIGGFHWYQATLRPWLWLLTRTADCRIFQEMTVPDIIKQVFRDHGFSDVKDALTGTYRKWDYCVQYRETAFAFVSRLMEQEGIYYFFQHETGKHTLVLADAINAHGPTDGYATVPFYPPDAHGRRERDHLSEWSVAQEIQPGRFVHDDFDFERPKAELQAAGVIKRQHAAADFEVYDYPGEYVVAKDGDRYAAARIEAFQAQHEQLQGAGNARGLTTGALFTLEKCPREDQNREYLIVGAEYAVQSNEYRTGPGESGGTEYAVRLTAIPSKQQYRSPGLTPRPVVQGPQTALVVGPKGKEIWTDKYGRVKVQFHWDRLGKNDEKSSCWIRVAQVWAGKTWGGIQIPRIGQEVVVEFLEGDPDRPLITGRVYNADQMPPYALPDNATQSGMKSRTSADGSNQTFNELRFEDKKDAEQVYLHAEKDFDRVVENNDTLKVGFDKKDKGDRTVEVFNNQTVKVGTSEAADGSESVEVFNNQTLKVGCSDAKDGSQTITVWKNRTETVQEGNEAVTIKKGHRTVTVEKGNDTHEIKQGHRAVTIGQGNDELTITQGNQTIKITAGKSTIQAGQAIELKVGGNSIVIDQSGIKIKGLQIAVEGTAKVELKGPMTDVSGDGMLNLKGGMVKIN